MNDTIEATLPESFYQTLQALSDTVTEGFNKLTSKEENSKNFLNPIDRFAETLLGYKDSDKSDYEKLGSALMVGGAKTFFDYYKKVKRQFDYTSVKDDVNQIAPNIVVNVPEKEIKNDKQPESNFLKQIIKGFAIGIAALGIIGGTGVLGQITESVTYLPNLFDNTILNPKWRASTFAVLAKWAKTLGKPFESLVNAIPKFENIFSGVSNIVTSGIAKLGTAVEQLQKIKIFEKLGGIFSRIYKATSDAISLLFKFGSNVTTALPKAVGNFGNILGRAALTYLKPLGIALKRLPLIGTALSFYQAYLRFQKGEIFQGILEIVAGIFGLLPGPGTAIAIGINAMQMLIDNNMGGGGVIGVTKAVITRIGEAAGKGFLVKMTNGIFKLLKPLGFAIKRIPILGSLINFGMAISQFSKGGTAAGVINVISGLVGLIDLVLPGVGSALSLAIDVLSSFVLTDSGNLDLGEGSVLNNIGDWISDVFSWIKDKIKNIGKWLWDGITSAWDWVVNNLKMFFIMPAASIGLMSSQFGELFDWVPDIFNTISEWPGKIWDKVKEKVVNIKNTIVDKVKGAWDWVSNIFSKNEDSEELIKNEKINSIADTKTAQVAKQIERPEVPNVVPNQITKQIEQPKIPNIIPDQVKLIDNQNAISYQDNSGILKESDTKLIEGLNELSIGDRLDNLRNKLIDYYTLFTGKLGSQLAIFEAKINENYNRLANINDEGWINDILPRVKDEVNNIIDKTVIEDNIDKRLTDNSNLKIEIDTTNKKFNSLRGAFNKVSDVNLKSFKYNEDKLVKSNEQLLNAVISVRDAIIKRPISSGNNILINSGSGFRPMTGNNPVDPRLAYV